MDESDLEFQGINSVNISLSFEMISEIVSWKAVKVHVVSTYYNDTCISTGIIYKK